MQIFCEFFLIEVKIIAGCGCGWFPGCLRFRLLVVYVAFWVQFFCSSCPVRRFGWVFVLFLTVFLFIGKRFIITSHFDQLFLKISQKDQRYIMALRCLYCISGCYRVGSYRKNLRLFCGVFVGFVGVWCCVLFCVLFIVLNH